MSAVLQAATRPTLFQRLDVPPSDRAAICRLYEGGMSLDATVQRSGYGHKVVRRVLREEGVPIRSCNRWPRQHEVRP